ncbi:4a-hydroxytetrahydrobiopterin dehydratase [Candidatus Woesearchaeota archaeon]|nr:4a-hydroxytetrahydrobiopterin dehydratase [Candidatus Woesearchaeota archaeon]
MKLAEKKCLQCEGGTPPMKPEEAGHHPDITISWNKVTLLLTTHAIKGLSENDFIMAAKIDTLS